MIPSASALVAPARGEKHFYGRLSLLTCWGSNEKESKEAD
jgi:hypothetical protein